MPGDHHEDETTSRRNPSPRRCRADRRRRGRLRRLGVGHGRRRLGVRQRQPAPKTATGTVSTRETKLGRSSSTPDGRTLYLFEKDKGATSSCIGACASIWPPLTAGKAKAGTGVTAAELGTTKRSDGKTEITYAGHPLYTYAGDQKPGDVAGQGLDQFGAEWYVLAPDGHKIDNG